MKKIIGICGFLLFSFGISKQLRAQQTGIQFFEGTWQQALEKADREHKMIFVDCNTSWCGPCKQMAKTVFPQKEVSDFYNTHFINVNMDMEKGEGPALRKQYEVTAFPTLLFVKPGGYSVSEAIGFKDADSLLICARVALLHKDSVSLKEKFDKGPRDTAFLRAYFRNMIHTQSRNAADVALDTIIRQEGNEAFYKSKYWDLLVLADVNSPLGLWFTGHRKEFTALYGADAVSARVAGMYLNIGIMNSLLHLSKRDTTLFTKYKLKMAERNLPDLEFLDAVLDFVVDCKAGKVEEALNIGDRVLAKATPWQYHILVRLADWESVGYTDIRYQMAKWAVRAAEMTADKEMKEDDLKVADDLLNEITPHVYPSPKMYGLNI